MLLASCSAQNTPYNNYLATKVNSAEVGKLGCT